MFKWLSLMSGSPPPLPPSHNHFCIYAFICVTLLLTLLGANLVVFAILLSLV